MNFFDIAIPVLCLAGFVAQIALNYVQDFGSGRIEVETVYSNLTARTFPVLFQLSLTPAFNVTKLAELGYGQPIWYFRGENFTDSFIGWNEQNKSVRETFESLVTIKNLNEIVPEIYIFDAINSSSPVIIPVDIPVQPFYINNRFIVDISDYILEDFKVMWISFRLENNSPLMSDLRLEVEVYDKATLTSRYVSSLEMRNAAQKISLPVTSFFEHVYHIELR